MHSVYLLLGSNKGFRYKNLLLAQYFIQHQLGDIISLSSIYETAPWQVNHRTSYYNQCLLVRTYKSIYQVLNNTQKIERLLGRTQKKQNVARTIDIDILYFDDIILQHHNLEIPHPRLHLRNFTLIPLCEIQPNYIHPKLLQSNKSLLEHSMDLSAVKQLPK